MQFAAIHRIACVSCPSVFRALKRMDPQPENVEFVVFEFDKRFERFGNQFQFYDFNHPLDVPKHLHHSFDCVIADPPYLNRDCALATGQTMDLLLRSKSNPAIYCTGAVMEDDLRLLLGLRRCSFEPKHRCQLQNDFATFTSYDDSERLGKWLK